MRRLGRLPVRVFTDESFVGISEESRGLGVFRVYLDEMIKPLLIDMDPLRPR